MRTLALVSLASSLLVGCVPDTTGSGAEESSMESDSRGEGTSATSEAMTGDETSADGGSSSGEPGCTSPDTMVLWAADGELEAPMGLGVSEELGGIEVARSWAEESGSLILRFDLECGGPLYMWGLVYDQVGGDRTDNADSFYVRLDDDPESVWAYGCSSPSGTQFLWQWTRIDAWDGPACERSPLALDLPAGEHAIELRNREGGVDTNVAVIAAVVVSHDPVTDPLQFLDPDAVGE